MPKAIHLVIIRRRVRVAAIFKILGKEIIRDDPVALVGVVSGEL
jgi:hypothetical protein